MPDCRRCGQDASRRQLLNCPLIASPASHAPSVALETLAPSIASGGERAGAMRRNEILEHIRISMLADNCHDDRSFSRSGVAFEMEDLLPSSQKQLTVA